jgi:(p)ppGpp synthase/HD superfamily hydrolase
MGVAGILFEEGGIEDSDILVAAILHDTLEDTTLKVGEIEGIFGKKVLSIVQEVTNDPGLSSEENKRQQVKHAPYMFLGAKLADRLYNVRDLRNPPPDWSESKVVAYQQWEKKLLEALGQVNEPLEKALKSELNQDIAF